MGEGTALHIGAADLSWGDLRVFAFTAIAIAGIALLVWGRWHLRDWRIRRAIKRGDHEHADLIALDHDGDDPPRPLHDILKGFAIILIGTPVLVVFQLNLADEIEHMLGEGWGFAATMLAFGCVMALGWAWETVKRDAMSPEEIAALEEEEEHQRWLRSIAGDSMPGLLIALAGAAAILAAIYFLAPAITPG